MNRRFVSTVGLLLCGLFISALSTAQCLRSTVVNDYVTNYLGSDVSLGELSWTGDADSAVCNAGTISQLSQDRTLQRINYFRRLVGLPDSISFDTTLNRKCQEAALMMHANGTLNHNPPPTWLCYTTDGKDAAGRANLSFGHSTNAITSYISDHGSSNYPVGHRRWILSSRAHVFGHGSTSTKNVLWVIGNSTNPPPGLQFTAYPSPGFFPARLVMGRWSFSKIGATFDSTTITMTDAAGDTIDVTLEPLSYSYGDPTIVWVPNITQLSLYDSVDVTYTVTVSKVDTGGGFLDYTYDVVVIQAVHPPACLPGMVWAETQCGCIDSVLLSSPDGVKKSLSGIEVYPNPAKDMVEISLFGAVDKSTTVYFKNMMGKEVMKPITFTGKKLLDISHLLPGTYFLYTDSFSHVYKKLIVSDR